MPLFHFLTGTKETALISSLLAMTSAKQISISCRDEIIPDCTCTIQGINGFYDGSTKTYGCDDDPSFGKLAMNKFLNDTEELSTDATARRRVEIHNHNVGMEVRKLCTGTHKLLIMITLHTNIMLWHGVILQAHWATRHNSFHKHTYILCTTYFKHSILR